MAAAFSKAFLEYGIDIETSSVEAGARQLRDCPIRQELVLALLEWWSVLDARDETVQKKLIAIADKSAAIDPGWEKRLLISVSQAPELSDLLKVAEDPTLPRNALLFICKLLSTRVNSKSRGQILEVLSSTQKKYPGDFWLNELLGIQLLADTSRDPAEAVPYLIAAVALRPGIPHIRLVLGVAKLRCGRVDDALEIFRAALELDPDFVDGHTQLGIALLKARRTDEALSELRIAGQLQPNSALNHNNLGAVFQTQGQLDEAAAEFRRALELQPNYQLAYSNLGSVLNLQGHFDEATATLRQALEMKPDDADAHSHLGDAWHNQGRNADAIAEYQRALELRPQNHKFHINLGVALARHGQLNEALVILRRALKLYPDDFPILINLGNVLFRQRRFDDAIVSYRRAVELNPDSVHAHNSLGNAFRDSGRLDSAEAEYRRVLTLKPDDFAAHDNLGYILNTRSLWDDAIRELRRAIELKPNSALAHNQLAFALRRKGAFRELLETLRRLDEIGAATPNWKYPAKQMIPQAESLARLDESFADFLDGTAQPADPGELATLAGIALVPRRLPTIAAVWYRDAFAKDPSLMDDLFLGHRYQAACAAVLTAATANPEELSASESSAWRQQALIWLTADLDAIGNQPKTPALLPSLASKLMQWLNDPDLKSIRDLELVDAIPEAERPGFEELWSNVRAQLTKLMDSQSTILPAASGE
jgi:tetratricopeptide (TPR) repeat protein